MRRFLGLPMWPRAVSPSRKATGPMRRAAKGQLRMPPRPLRSVRRVGFADWTGFDTPNNSHMGKGRAAGSVVVGGFAVSAPLTALESEGARAYAALVGLGIKHLKVRHPR